MKDSIRWTSKQFRQALEALKLTQTDFARLVGSTPRTARRWASEGPISGLVRETLRAWLILADHELPWRDYTWEVTRARKELERLSKLAGEGINSMSKTKRGDTCFLCDKEIAEDQLLCDECYEEEWPSEEKEETRAQYRKDFPEESEEILPPPPGAEDESDG